MRTPHRLPALALLLLLTSGCATLQWVGLRLFFNEQSVPDDRILREIPYAGGEASNPQKQVFDLFLPEGDDWPTLIFVHGGGWMEGDKDLEAGGYAIYGNIGAYYAQQGLGVAILNYRLQPEVSWREQVEDVTRAVARVREEVGRRGGDPDRLFLSGHSAGGQLASYVAVRGDAGPFCGVVAVSGAGYDLEDETTYELGAERAYYLRRFGTNEERDDAFDEGAAVVEHLDASDPPFLVFYAEREYESLQHQAKLLHERLQDAGVESELLSVPRQGHNRIVVTFSQEDHPMTGQVMDFIRRRSAECPPPHQAR